MQLRSKLLPIGGLLMTALLLIAVTSLAETMDSMREATEMTELLKNDIAEARRQEDELEELLELSGTDEFYERLARDRFGLVKQGEIIFIDNYR